jgi:hypothetical protein
MAEILEAMEKESTKMGMEILRSAPRFGPDLVPEPVLLEVGAVKASSSPTAGAFDLVTGTSRSAATEVVVDPVLHPSSV